MKFVSRRTSFTVSPLGSGPSLPALGQGEAAPASFDAGAGEPRPYAVAAAPRPAALRSASALSVRSHVKSWSSRPKWPYAAVYPMLGRRGARSRRIPPSRRPEGARGGRRRLVEILVPELLGAADADGLGAERLHRDRDGSDHPDHVLDL